jgi:excisionase family DNA binding protein
MDLEERFYTSTEVAEILGVSLRSIYRYLDENKLNAEVKTATGRHRFTKQNILDFLYPDGKAPKAAAKPVVPSVEETPRPAPAPEPQPEPQPQPVQETFSEPAPQPEPVAPAEPEQPSVDWLAKFRAAAEKHKQETEAAQVSQPEPEAQQPEPAAETVSGLTDGPTSEPISAQPSILYYKSGVGGLKEIAQNLDKSAKRSSIDYAFTMQAGLSLHKPIKPFSLLHAYIKSGDRDYFEKILQLTAAAENDAQLGLMISDDMNLYASKKEMHGLNVVSDIQLRKDLMENGEVELARELED